MKIEYLGFIPTILVGIYLLGFEVNGWGDAEWSSEVLFARIVFLVFLSILCYLVFGGLIWAMRSFV